MGGIGRCCPLGQDPNNVPIELVREIKPCFARPENSFLHTIKHIKLHLMRRRFCGEKRKQLFVLMLLIVCTL